jgi:hypothetical protein
LSETHRATTEALNAVLRGKSRLEAAGQDSDERLEDAAFEAEVDALTELIETTPSTLAGVIASMVYITESAERDHYRYSEEYLVPLLANLCEALQGLSGQEGGGHENTIKALIDAQDARDHRRRPNRLSCRGAGWPITLTVERGRWR